MVRKIKKTFTFEFEPLTVLVPYQQTFELEKLHVLVPVEICIKLEKGER